MSTHKIHFYGDLEKIIPELSQNALNEQILWNCIIATCIFTSDLISKKKIVSFLRYSIAYAYQICCMY